MVEVVAAVDAAGEAEVIEVEAWLEALSVGAGVVSLVVVDELWRVATIAASAAIPTTVNNKTRFELFFSAVLATGVAAAVGFTGAGVLEIREEVLGTGGMTIAGTLFFAADFLTAAFLAGAFLATLFFAADFLTAAFLAGAFLATFFADDFFTAAFFAATVLLLKF